MADLLRSAFSLARYHGGYAKSAAQAQYLADQSPMYGSSSVYGNPVRWTVLCDSLGVYEIRKETRKEGESVWWQRGAQADAKSAQARADRDRVRYMDRLRDAIDRAEARQDRVLHSLVAQGKSLDALSSIARRRELLQARWRELN